VLFYIAQYSILISGAKRAKVNNDNLTKEQRACRGRLLVGCGLKCGKYYQYRWETKRYNGDDNASSSTRTALCTRKYELT